MLISRKLAHQVDNRFQVLIYLIERHDEKQAIEYIRQLSSFIHSHVETAEDEQARARRENPGC